MRWRWLLRSSRGACSGARRGPTGPTVQPVVGGLTSTTVHFPRALGTPAASSRPPLFALARSFHPRAASHTFVSVTLSGLESASIKTKRSPAPADPLPRIDAPLIRFFAWASPLTTAKNVFRLSPGRKRRLAHRS